MTDDQNEGFDSGSRDRATVALVSEQVKGVERLVDAGFANMQRQLDQVSSLPVAVAELKAQNVDQEKRIKRIEDDDKGNSEWRRTHLPALAVSVGLLGAAIVTLMAQLH
ncbi:MAG: hypothetical protein JO130_18660 [Solirubrobacterales bacterium]|nr:hypothetical protein [Solirubrobacterales bacterium]